jgi:hypothetical protein
MMRRRRRRRWWWWWPADDVVVPLLLCLTSSQATTHVLLWFLLQSNHETSSKCFVAPERWREWWANHNAQRLKRNAHQRSIGDKGERRNSGREFNGEDHFEIH